uniref:DIS3-like exonuclease 1 n=2 Tax=Ditylum brightwellii TaxID=49249 RepID=A0A7S4VSA2_9STRA
MTYQQAHNILHNKPPDDPNQPPPPPLTAGSPVDTKLIPSLKKDLTILTKLARILRKNREEIGGAVDLSSGDRGSELKFSLDENGLPTKVVAKTEMEIHHTIAELMIMANGHVASKIHGHFPSSSLLRNHRTVEQNRFEDLESAFKAGGVSFDGRSNMALAESLRQAKASGKDGAVIDSLFQSLATRAMSEAQYVCTGSKEASVGLSHYGLGIEKYTHFTSPIRRYADVVVHRLLLAAVTKKDDADVRMASLDVGVNRNALESIPDSAAMSVLAGDGLEGGEQKEQSDELEGDDLLDFLLEETSQLGLDGDDDDGSNKLDETKADDETKETDGKSSHAEADPYSTAEVTKICEGINHQNRISKLCSMSCQRLFLSLYFRGNTDVAPAVVIGLRANGLLVYVPKYDMKGPVFLSDKDGNVQIHPSVMGLPSKAGLPPTSGFAIVDGCKRFPDGSCDICNADDEANKYLQVIVPAGSSSVHCDFRLLDVIEVQLSCDTSDVVARIPPTRLHLISKGKKPKIGRTNETKVTTKLVEQRQKESSVTNDEHTHPMYKAIDVDISRNVYHIFSSIQIQPNLDDTLPRFLQQQQQNHTKKTQKQKRVQTMPGRFVFGGFRNPDTHTASQEAAANAAAEAAAQRRNTVVQGQASSREYDVVRRIEKDIMSRMQRLAAEKRHTRRAKAGK